MSDTRRAVSFTGRSVVFCLLSIAYLVSMSFIVYVMEPTPFDNIRRALPTYPDVATSFNRSASQLYAHQFQLLYNNKTLPSMAMYYHDRTNSVDIMRTFIMPTACSSPGRLLNSIIGAAYFPPDAKPIVVDCICGNGSYLDVARSLRFNFVIIPSSSLALWIQPGNDILGDGDDGWTIYAVFAPAKIGVAWRWIKFIYRVLACAVPTLVLVCLYIKNVWHLRNNVAAIGIDASAVRYEIDSGNPTSVIVSNPWLCLAFVVDICANSEYIGQACLRLCQTQDMTIFLFANLYLGRTVWCAYATLIAINAYRKRFDWPKSFPAASPVILTLVTYFVAGFLTFVQSLWPALIDVYGWLFSLHKLCDDTGHNVAMDAVLGVFVFLVTICALPIGTKLLQSMPCYRSATVPHRSFNSISPKRSGPSSVHGFAAITPANGKRASKSTQSDDFCAFSGTISFLNKIWPYFQDQAAISQQGAACQIKGYDTHNNLVINMRVILLSQIDMKGKDPNVALVDARDLTSAVGRLAVEARVDGGFYIRMRRGASDSPWILSDCCRV
ncbi:unnamed protein product [Aphanomyces euteiches]